MHIIIIRYLLIYRQTKKYCFEYCFEAKQYFETIFETLCLLFACVSAKNCLQNIVSTPPLHSRSLCFDFLSLKAPHANSNSRMHKFKHMAGVIQAVQKAIAAVSTPSPVSSTSQASARTKAAKPGGGKKQIKWMDENDNKKFNEEYFETIFSAATLLITERKGERILRRKSFGSR